MDGFVYFGVPKGICPQCHPLDALFRHLQNGLITYFMYGIFPRSAFARFNKYSTSGSQLAREYRPFIVAAIIEGIHFFSFYICITPTYVSIHSSFCDNTLSIYHEAEITPMSVVICHIRMFKCDNFRTITERCNNVRWPVS